MKLAIGTEYRIANYFKSKEGLSPKIKRGLSTYVILVGSKFIMLEAVNIMFGDKVQFTGPLNGVVAFFAVIFVIIIAETIVGKIYFALGDKQLRKELFNHDYVQIRGEVSARRPKHIHPYCRGGGSAYLYSSMGRYCYSHGR